MIQVLPQIMGSRPLEDEEDAEDEEYSGLVSSQPEMVLVCPQNTAKYDIRNNTTKSGWRSPRSFCHCLLTTQCARLT